MLLLDTTRPPALTGAAIGGYYKLVISCKWKPLSETLPSPADRRLEQLQAVARVSGFKLTHQRLAILQAVARTDHHPDAETVWQSVRSRIPTLSLTTVYRTLWLLADAGIVAAVAPGGGRVRFDANIEPHAHFVCIRCGATRDLAACDSELACIADRASPLGRVITTSVEVRGICADCGRAAPGRLKAAPRGIAGQVGTK